MKRRSSERTLELSISKDNLLFPEQAETLIRAMKILWPNEEIVSVHLGIPDIIPVKLTIRDTTKEVEVLELT